MNWFEKHPNWLFNEASQLASDPHYTQDHIAIAKTMVSSGKMAVYGDKKEEFFTIIIYPEATPYVPPTIFLLSNPFSEEQILEFSQLTLNEIRLRIASEPDRKRIFNRRHQNSDGSICFIETGDFHGDNAEKIQISDILERIREWLGGCIPIDSREAELFYHFINQSCQEEFLLPDIFFDENLCSGFFTLAKPLLHLSIGCNKNVFIGVNFSGKNSQGIEIPPKEITNLKSVLFANIPSFADVFLNLESFQNAVKKGDFLKGVWTDIPSELNPVSDIQELGKFLGNEDLERGLSALLTLLGDELKKSEVKIVFLGLRFPGRNYKFDWQFFKISKPEDFPFLFDATHEELKQQLLKWKLEAIFSEKITDDYFHVRNFGRADRESLKGKKISIIGCGALGGEIADSLAKAGVGTMTLVDKGIFRYHNAVRHVIPITRTASTKVSALGEYLVTHNPFVNVDPKLRDISDGKIEEFVLEEQIGVSSIADDNLEAFLNELAIEKTRTIFYSRALRGGKAGRIFRVIPHVDACKNCLSLYKVDRHPDFTEIEEDGELPELTNECNNPVRPASSSDLKMIASITSSLIIKFLENSNQKENQWVWTTEGNENAPFKLTANFLPPHPNCPVCKPINSSKVYICKDAKELVESECHLSGKNETGGVLVGYKDENGNYNVVLASKSGPKAIKSPTRFERDIEFCQCFLDESAEKMGDKGLYIGEWHFHPRGNNEPSGTDIKSLTEIASSKQYLIDKPIMIIRSSNGEFGITIHEKTGRCHKVPIIFKES